MTKTKKRRIVIKYKEFLFETFERMSFEDLLQYYKEVKDDANDIEEHGGAPVYRTDAVTDRKAHIIGEYLGENYEKEMNVGLESNSRDYEATYGAMDEGERKQRHIEDDIEYLKDEELHKCECCGKETMFSLNMCEECFDNEIDNHYDGGRDD